MFSFANQVGLDMSEAMLIALQVAQDHASGTWPATALNELQTRLWAPAGCNKIESLKLLLCSGFRVPPRRRVRVEQG